MSCVDEKVMNSEIEKLKEIFGSLTVSCGKDRNIWEWCLILLRKEQVVIEMQNYTQELLEYTETKTSAPTPAEVNLFDVNYKNKLLTDVERAKFHTVVVKL